MEENLNTLINKTKDYKKFSLLEYNREIDKNHAKKLMLSIQQSNDLHLFPIIVTPELQIIDGQHRWWAAKELKVDIYYVIDNDYRIDKITIFNNNQRKWVLEDHLKKYVNLNNENYIKLNELLKDLNYSLNIVLTWLNESNNRQAINFKNGNFKFNVTETTIENLLKAKQITDFMKDSNFKPISVYTQIYFHCALKKVIVNEFIDFDRFYKHFTEYFHLFRFCSLSFEYAEVFQEIYNHHQHKNFINIQKERRDYKFVN